jgi:hypothetical protein
MAATTEQGTLPDLAANRGVPLVTAPQFMLVEPYLDPGSAQRVRHALGHGGILVRMAEK